MGTNYYAVKNGPSQQGAIHIGKSSAGWLFCFQYQDDTWHDPPVVWRSWEEVKDWLKRYTVDTTDYAIIDEYDRVISYDDFVERVENKQNDTHCRYNPDNFRYSDNVGGYRFMAGNFS